MTASARVVGRRAVEGGVGATSGVVLAHRVTVVLVRTHSPGNLGSAARAVTNFGAKLALVEPRVALDHPDIAAHASGADAPLASAVRLGSVEEASSHFDLVVALSSERGRRAAGLPPRTTVAALRRALTAGRRVALVFGPERGGLLTEEVLACDARWSLPTEPSFPTLNLAQAVAVALALVRGARVAEGAKRPADEPAGGQVWRTLVSEARRSLTVGFPDQRKRPDVVDELLALLRRARPTQRETELLLAALSRYRRACGAGSDT